jgi:hypothetical protein
VVGIEYGQPITPTIRREYVTLADVMSAARERGRQRFSGEQIARPAEPPAGRGETDGTIRLGHRDVSPRATVREPARQSRSIRFYTTAQLLVLHAHYHRPRRESAPVTSTQHAAVHGLPAKRSKRHSAPRNHLSQLVQSSIARITAKSCPVQLGVKPVDMRAGAEAPALNGAMSPAQASRFRSAHGRRLRTWTSGRSTLAAQDQLGEMSGSGVDVIGVPSSTERNRATAKPRPLSGIWNASHRGACASVRSVDRRQKVACSATFDDCPLWTDQPGRGPGNAVPAHHSSARWAATTPRTTLVSDRCR